MWSRLLGSLRSRAETKNSDVTKHYSLRDGVPPMSVDRLLCRYPTEMKRLRDQIPLSDEHYDALMVPVIRRYAEYVHLLPASENHHHCHPGGLLQHGLQVAQLSAQMAKGTPRDIGSEHRLRRQPGWAVVAAVVGLLHDIGKVCCDVRVCNESEDIVWNPAEESLLRWAARTCPQGYFVRWVSGRHGRHVEKWSALGHTVIAGEFTAWLLRQDLDIRSEFYDAAPGSGSADNRTAQNLQKADSLSTARSLVSAGGTEVHSHFVNALRALVASGKLEWNRPGRPLWHLAVRGTPGIYVAWPMIAEVVLNHLRDAQVPSIPQRPDDILEKLIERGTVIQRPDGSCSTKLLLSVLKSPLNCVRLADHCLRSPSLPAVQADTVPESGLVVAEDNANAACAPAGDHNVLALILSATKDRAVQPSALELTILERFISQNRREVHLTTVEFAEFARIAGLAKGELYQELRDSSLFNIVRLADGVVSINLAEH